MKTNRISSWFAGIIFVMSLIAAPLTANADYATCTQSCAEDGYDDSYCSRVCSE